MKPTAPHIERCLNCQLPDCNEYDPRCSYLRPYRDKGKSQTTLYFLRHPGLKKKIDADYYSKNKKAILQQKKKYYKKNRKKILKNKKAKAKELEEQKKLYENLIILLWVFLTR